MTLADELDKLGEKLARKERLSSSERDTIRRAVEALRAGDRLAQRVEFFCEAAELAGEGTKTRGGQHVMPQGDFVFVTPSVASRLHWWALEFRALLNERPSAAERSESNE